MFPEEFIKRIETQKYIEAGRLLAALGEPAPVSIRLNSTKWDKVPAGGKSVPWCNTGFYLPVRPSFTADPLFHAGCYYPQEASSMFIGEVFNQLASGLKDIRVLDLCGAPGGKSTHLSSLIGKNGVLIANEVIKQRASVLSENITKWGEGNAIVTSGDPSAFSSMEGYFDVILVDAPCSGEGMFRDAVAVKEWSPKNAALCSERQRRILSDVWPALKENGILIYSTCTFNPAENEENISWLAEQKDVTSLKLDISSFEGIKTITFNGIEGYGFHPGSISGDGLFVAALRKNGSGGGHHSFPSRSPLRNSSKDEISVALEYTDADPANLFTMNDFIIHVPVKANEFAYLSGNLGIVKAGTDLLRVRGKDFNPLHDLALSSLLKKDAFPVFDAGKDQSLAYLRRENFRIDGMPSGWIIIRYCGVNLGFVKNIGSRINNYYPVEWRIRMSADNDRQLASVIWKD